MAREGLMDDTGYDFGISDSYEQAVEEASEEGYNAGFGDGIKATCEILNDLIDCQDCRLSCMYASKKECVENLYLYVIERIKEKNNG